MAGIAGFNCILSVGATPTVVGKAKDVDLTGDSNPIDITTRSGAGWKEFIAGLREWSAEVGQLWVASDAALVILRDAFLNGTAIAVKFDDGAGKGFTSTCIVTKMKRGEQLNGAVELPVSLKGASALVVIP